MALSHYPLKRQFLGGYDVCQLGLDLRLMEP